MDPNNAREHPKENLSALAKSLKRFNQQKPVIISESNQVIAGNGTILAAKELGWTHITAIRSDLSGSKQKAYAIADNRTAELAAWNNLVLGKSLNELQLEGFDLADIGFEDWKNPEVFEGQCDEDEVPEQVETTTVLGDLYLLGDHRLLCGDSTNVQHVERLMASDKVDMVFTDPPYGIKEITDRVTHVKTFKKQGIAKKGSYSPIIGDDSIETATAAWNIVSTICGTVILWGGNYYDFPPSPCWIVWDKREEDSQTDLNSDAELAYVKHPYKKSVRVFRHLWKGMIKASERNEARIHPTQKPVALAEWCFKNYGDPKIVLDLFLGSGSTLIACEKTKRRCFGMEIDPHYCDVIVARWEKFTGKKATLEQGVRSENGEL